MSAVSLGQCPITGPAGATVVAALQFFAASQCLLQESFPPQADIASGAHFDFIIVGAGTAGSALAARLAEMHQFTVLLVEAGGNPPVESVIPGFRTTMIGTKFDWNYTTMDDGYASQSLIDQRERQPRGRMLGGSGSINDMVYSRGHPVDYEQWAEIVGEDWAWENVLPYFKKTENMIDERITYNSELMQYHGQDGEIQVTGFANYTQTTDILMQSFEELGFNIVDDMTYPNKIGAGRFSHTIRNGRRDSSLTAMLNNVDSDNLYVIKDTLVTRILIENNAAVGVEAVHNGEQMSFYADKEVIVSAGTFNTPKLLLLSGIGPQQHLEEMGIEVVQDLPIGDNLNDHVMVIYYIALESGMCSTNESYQMFEVIQYLKDQSGMLSYSDSMGAYLPESCETENVPYFAIYPTCIAQSLLQLDMCKSLLGLNKKDCEKLVKENEEHELVPIPVVLLKPKSRGRVRLSSVDPLEAPEIYASTFSDVYDLEGYPEAVKKGLSIVDTSYFKKKGARIIDMTPEICKDLEEDEMIRCHVKEYAMTAWHAVGTAAMGRVVDGELQVLGVDALRVVDASVMPTVIRGNTNAPVVMIAEKAADFIKKSHNYN